MTPARPLLLVTVDVEEDMPGWEIQPEVTTENVAALPGFVEELRSLGVRTTLLCDHPVLAQPRSAEVLRRHAREEDCELGTHLHAWNTPPIDAAWEQRAGRAGAAYYQSELPVEQFRAKLAAVHALATEVAGRAPTSFRAGRFGIDGQSLVQLVALGYRVDTSVIPLSEHTADGGPDHRAAPRLPYRPSRDDPARTGDLPLLEIPLSIGLSRRLPRWLEQLYLRSPRALHLRGLLSHEHLGLVDYAWLYPARFEAEPMCRVADALVARGAPVLNVFLHSSELIPGASGSVRTEEDATVLRQRMRALLEHCLRVHAAEPLTLTEAADRLAPDLAARAQQPAATT